MMRNGGVKLRLIAIGIVVCLSMAVLQPARAGLLLLNGNAALSGTVQLLDTNAANLHYGDIEYAVFTAAGFMTAFPGSDTTNGGVLAGEVVYAFQVIDNGAKTSGITQFSAGLADVGGLLFPNHHGDGGNDIEEVNTGDSGFVVGTGQAPTSLSAISSSVPYKFQGGANVLQNETSAVLFYTSPWGPTWDNGSTTSGAGQSRIPAPEVGVELNTIPEPSSVALASLALMGLALLGRRRVGN